MRRPGKIWLGVVAFFAVMTGLGALRYALPHVPFPAPLPNFLTRRIALSIHASCGAIALMLGPWQFLPGIRARRLSVHRYMGWAYASLVVVSWAASLPIAAHAQTGVWASAGFLSLGAFWIACTAAAVMAVAVTENFAAHRRWMIRSYALTAAAITLRIYLPFSILMHWPYAIAYPAIAWLCWIPNLIGAEIYLRVGRRAGLEMVSARAAS
jgi:uncharacterized membrane protein